MGDPDSSEVPGTLFESGAGRFWLAVIVIGLGTGVGTIALTLLLETVQHWAWPGPSSDLLASVNATSAWHRVSILLGAGVLTGVGQLVLVRLSSGNGIDITQAIWFSAGRLPTIRTLGSAVLSVILVGMGVSLRREGAPKQVGAVIANAASDKGRLSDSQRRLLVACGAGSEMAAAYGVPLGGALFALELLRGALSLRLVLPALMTALIATAVSWTVLPDAPTYVIPAYASSTSAIVWALLAGPVAGLVSVAYVRAIAYADRHKPQVLRRLFAPLIALGLLGIVSTRYPEVLGNGKDIAQLAFVGEIAPALLLILFVLKPLATILCLGSGTPGGLFTPSLALGALLGGLLGQLWSAVVPGLPPGLFAVIGASAMLAATTQGPISAVVLIMELTGRGRSFIVPMLLAVATATLVARSIEPRSIYEARLNEEEVTARRKARNIV